MLCVHGDVPASRHNVHKGLWVKKTREKRRSRMGKSIVFAQKKCKMSWLAQSPALGGRPNCEATCPNL